MSSKKNKNTIHVLVLFRKTQKAFYVRSYFEDLSVGDAVVVKTERGLEIGEVYDIATESDTKVDFTVEGKIVRKLTEVDQKQLDQLHKKEIEAFDICVAEINELKLPMKLLSVEYMFDGKKAIFYFSAPERVDFRELVKRLASRLSIRVEMRQVGVRDEAKLIGGLGPCGLNLCCSAFLTAFESVNIKMAKNQGLPMNTFKISGLCGRLMCCLNYENKFYEEFLSCVPQTDQTVITPDGPGKVVGYQYVNCAVEVELESEVRKFYPLHQITDVNGKAFGGCSCRECNRECAGVVSSSESDQPSEKEQ